MLDQTYIINSVKETCCYVAQNKARFRADLEACRYSSLRVNPFCVVGLTYLCRANPRRNDIVQEYLLPDFSTNRAGRLKADDDIITETDQILYMENERFSIPEVLFNPSDIGKAVRVQ